MALNNQLLQKQLYRASQNRYQNIKEDLTPWFRKVFHDQTSAQNSLTSFEIMLGKELRRLRISQSGRNCS